jgi:glycosyltransferase involved in cell wall biosynthesis
VRVLIAEPNGAGHRLVYVRVLAKAAIDSGHEVWLLLGRSCSGRPFETHLKEIEDLVEMDFDWDGGLASLERASTRLHADRVVVPHGDLLLGDVARVGWAGDGRLSVLVMRDPKGEGLRPSRYLIGRMKLAAIAIASRRRSVDLFWLGQVGDPAVRLGRPVVTDPFITSVPRSSLEERARRLRERFSSGRTIVGVAGALTERKNVPLVLEAAGLFARDSQLTLSVLVSGSVGSDVTWDAHDLRRIAARHGYELVLDLRLHTNEEINVVVAGVDLLVTAYSIHYPNSSLIKAQALGTRAVVAGNRFTRRRVRHLAGVESARLDAKDIARALARAMEDDRPQGAFEELSGEFGTRLLEPVTT